MKVLVDSSVWADFFNGYESPEADALAKLIDGEEDVCTCGLIVSEVFQGLKRTKGRSEVESLFRELLFLEPTGVDVYFRAAEIYRTLRKRGVTVRSTIDCIIAALADENRCYLLAKDRDLRLVVDSGLLETRLWPV